jgi:CRISPR/Cas system CMR-associated protein Cmr5 small subunit
LTDLAFVIDRETSFNELLLEIPELIDNNGDLVTLMIKSDKLGSINTADEDSMSNQYLAFNNDTRIL